MSSELHAKILEFLAGEFSKKDERQCVRLDLLHAQPNARDEEIRQWIRVEKPDLFETLTLIEQLTSDIIEITEGHADSFGYGAHRYVLRTHQHLGGSAAHGFRIKPSYEAVGDPQAMTAPGQGQGANGGDAMGAMLQNNTMLMRTNQQMFQSAFGTLAEQARAAAAENVQLRTENSSLRIKLEEAQSTKDEREYQFSLAAQKSQRSNLAVEKLLQLGTVVAAKITGVGAGAGGGDGLSMLLVEFGKSLKPQQLNQFVKILDQSQMVMFFSIMEMVGPQGQGGQQQGTQGQQASGQGPSEQSQPSP